MADMRFYWQETGVALYALVHRLSDNKVWDAVAGDWATYAVADLDDYDIACAETPAASYWYQLTVPADADFTAGRYHVAVFRKAGANPAVADLLVAEDELYWDGSAVADPLHTGNVAVATNGVRVGSFIADSITNAAFAAGALTEAEIVIDDTEAADAADVVSSFWERLKYLVRSGLGTNKINFDGTVMQTYNDAAAAALIKHTTTEAAGTQTRNAVDDA